MLLFDRLNPFDKSRSQPPDSIFSQDHEFDMRDSVMYRWRYRIGTVWVWLVQRFGG